jgi:two-component system, OmpR family, sensor histidine kinase QseC
MVMRTSIRRLLLINLLVCVALIISLTAIGVYYLGSDDVDQLMDRELVHSSLVVQALLNVITEDKELKQAQKNLNAIFSKESKILDLYPNKQSLRNNSLEDFPLQYQLWNKAGHLVLRSNDAPIQPLSNGRTGFSNTYLNGKSWRIYTSYNPETGNTFIVGARDALQTWLKQSVAKDDLYIMLLTFPVLGMLIWLVLAHGLSSIKRIAKEMGTRAANYLEPIDIKQVPEEIAALVDELNKLLLRLKQAMEREQRFASDAAHELKTPLAAILTQAQVALKTTKEKDVAHALEKVVAGVDRSTHVVHQLLTLSRLVPGASLGNQNTIDIVNIAKDIISELIPIAIEKNIDIALSNSEKNIQLHANGITIGVLLRNLIDNAIRYTPENGNVDVNLFTQHNKVIIRVSDNGAGIPPKLRARVFERFFRVLGTKTSGSGLGLAIVQQIAELHGAQVKLDSPESGTGLQIDVVFTRKITTKAIISLPKLIQ